jgi:uncharacterized membrane protein YdbT with pleckstrin-like domain
MELMDGETVIWHGRPSWRASIAFYLKWGVPSLVPAVATLIWGEHRLLGVAATVVLLALVLLIGWLRRLGSLYTVTSRRLVIRRGILSRAERSAHLDRVQNVNSTQSFVQRLLGVGTVDFDTAGTEDSDFRFEGVADPIGLRTRIDRETPATALRGR